MNIGAGLSVNAGVGGHRYPCAMVADPHVSVVVPVLDEEATVEPLYRGIVASLDGAGIPGEVIFVDDGSTDATFERLSHLHDSDPRLRVVSFDRNYGQHPAMHAGITRARGEIVVTMDGDLQNAPSDIPHLVAAVEAGADVASGRRLGRADPTLRRLPSAAINRMLARLTGVDLSDFGCAFNAYRRDALDPVMHRIGRQKFTKAIVCSTGVTVVEVDLQHRAREDQSRYRPIALVKMGLQVIDRVLARALAAGGAPCGSCRYPFGRRCRGVGPGRVGPERQPARSCARRSGGAAPAGPPRRPDGDRRRAARQDPAPRRGGPSATTSNESCRSQSR